MLYIIIASEIICDKEPLDICKNKNLFESKEPWDIIIIQVIFEEYGIRVKTSTIKVQM